MVAVVKIVSAILIHSYETRYNEDNNPRTLSPSIQGCCKAEYSLTGAL